MVHLPRVAKEIQTIGLYDLVLQDIQKITGKENPSYEEILDILKQDSSILESYKQINLEYNLSNIHLKNIDTDNIPKQCKDKAIKINQNLDKLRDIEKYTLDFEQSSTLVIIFSIEFFVLFSVQYFIVLLDLKEWQWWIYALFALSIVIAWLYAKKIKQKYRINSLIFEDLYDKTLDLIKDLEEKGCIDRKDLIIQECDEHV